MKLGVMVITDRHLAQLCGLTRAALRKGHTVGIFVTDEGTRLLASREFSSVVALPGVAASYCDQSARRHGGRPAGLPETVVSGSQLQNAIMVSESDRLIVL